MILKKTMNKTQAKQAYDEALRRLNSIAEPLGISSKQVRPPIGLDAVLDFAVELSSCQDDAAARKAIEHYIHATASFLYLATMAGDWLASGDATKYDGPTEVGPFFYLGTFASSYINKELKKVP